MDLVDDEGDLVGDEGDLIVEGGDVDLVGVMGSNRRRKKLRVPFAERAERDCN